MKFKKHISILLSFFLLVSNVGFAIDVHYCGGEIASVKPVLWNKIESLVTVGNSCCAPKIEKKGGCCKEKVINFQKKSENTVVSSISFQPNFNFLFEEWNPIIYSKVSIPESTPIASYCCQANAPPLFQLNHQYIFYA